MQMKWYTRLWCWYMSLPLPVKILMILAAALGVLSLFIPKFGGSAMVAGIGALAAKLHTKPAPTQQESNFEKMVQAHIDEAQRRTTVDAVITKEGDKAAETSKVDWDNTTSAAPPKRLP